METPKLLISGLLICLLIPGCSTLKRYQSASYKGEKDGLVEMKLFGSSLENALEVQAGKSLWDLSASAQTQMIHILHERYPENAQFEQALNRSYLQDGMGPVLDYTRSDLRMVFSISKVPDPSFMDKAGGVFSPADRIEKISFSLKLKPESGLRFTGWNHYTTEYGEIEIGDLSFSRSLDLEAGLSGDLAEGSAKQSAGRSEDQTVRKRFLKLSGSLSDQVLKMEEEGNREIDLAGNVIADVSLAFESFAERVIVPLYSGTGEVSALKFVDVLVPHIKNAPERIMATLQMDYIYRHVESGEKTYAEHDDRVAYFKGSSSQEVKLFDKSDYVPAFCCIGTDVGPDSEHLRIRTGTGAEYLLQFFSYPEALRFFDWLLLKSEQQTESSEAPFSIGGMELLFRGAPLSWTVMANENNLKVLSVY